MNHSISLCHYANKPCREPRAMKETGELHRLCAFHRAKSNDAQRRWYVRQQKGSDAAPLRAKRVHKIPSCPQAKRTRPLSTIQITSVAMHTQPSSVEVVSLFSTCSVLNDDDLAFLNEYFFNDMDAREEERNAWTTMTL